MYHFFTNFLVTRAIFCPIFANGGGHVRDGDGHGGVHDGRDVRDDDDVRHVCDRIFFMLILQLVLLLKI